MVEDEWILNKINQEKFILIEAALHIRLFFFFPLLIIPSDPLSFVSARRGPCIYSKMLAASIRKMLPLDIVKISIHSPD